MKLKVMWIEDEMMRFREDEEMERWRWSSVSWRDAGHKYCNPSFKEWLGGVPSSRFRRLLISRVQFRIYRTVRHEDVSFDRTIHWFDTFSLRWCSDPDRLCQLSVVSRHRE
jgi:hypothetical protein